MRFTGEKTLLNITKSAFLKAKNKTKKKQLND